MSRRICLVFAGSFVLAACNLFAQQDSQYDDSRNPYYKQAEQDLDNNKAAAAASDYESALAANPKLAEAHYQLGMIYGDKLNDPVGSIYHLRKYLELNPASDKAGQVNAMIQKQSEAFAASVPNTSGPGGDATAQLQAENATLKKQVDDAAQTIAKLQGQLAASGAAPAAGASPPVPPRALPLDATNAAPLAAGAPGVAAAAVTGSGGPTKTYKVVSGDSLWKISHKMYPGDTKNGIDKIKDANKDTLIEGKPLKIGQVLIIPP